MRGVPGEPSFPPGGGSPAPGAPTTSSLLQETQPGGPPPSLLSGGGGEPYTRSSHTPSSLLQCVMLEIRSASRGQEPSTRSSHPVTLSELGSRVCSLGARSRYRSSEIGSACRWSGCILAERTTPSWCSSQMDSSPPERPARIGRRGECRPKTHLRIYCRRMQNGLTRFRNRPNPLHRSNARTVYSTRVQHTPTPGGVSRGRGLGVGVSPPVLLPRRSDFDIHSKDRAVRPQSQGAPSRSHSTHQGGFYGLSHERDCIPRGCAEPLSWGRVLGLSPEGEGPSSRGSPLPEASSKVMVSSVPQTSHMGSIPMHPLCWGRTTSRLMRAARWPRIR